jgi:hypothetical protein
VVLLSEEKTAVYVFINYKQGQNPDHEFAVHLEKRLVKDDHCVFRDESGLVPSEKWTQRLYDEVRKCDTLIAIVSDSSLKSTWCLNEVDLARKLEKRILPIVMEDIDESLEFQTFKPRFMLTQWYRATGNFDKDADELAEILREDADKSYLHLFQATCAKHGIANPAELLEALMHTLHFTHAAPALGSEVFYHDGMEGITGPVRSVAESVERVCKANAFMNKHNSANSLKHGLNDQSKQQAWIAQRFECLGDALSQAIDLWNRQGEISRRQIDRYHQSKNQGNQDVNAS